jgi:L-seryl-tRNA(Ser) seleniumtransferase
LEPVLALYRSPEFLPERLTTLRLLIRSQSAMRAQAEKLAPLLQQALGPAYLVAAEPLFSQIGSGALPVDQLPSFGLSLRMNSTQRQRHGNGLGRIEKRLRELPRPVLGRIANDTLWLDLRCLESADEAPFIAQLSLLSA